MAFTLDPLRTRVFAVSLTTVLLATGCPGNESATTATTSTSSTTSSSTPDDSAGTTTADAPTTSTSSGTTADDPTGTTADDPTGTTTGDDDPTTGEELPDETTGGIVPVPPTCEDPSGATCNDPITNCKMDTDHDWVNFTCDNAPEVANPGQEDMDGDGFGDVADLCPILAGDLDGTADSDKDGVGNGCDVCARQLGIYNHAVPAVPFYMRVRNIPDQKDSDHDGVGDVCDNCVRVANCHDFGEGPGLTPHVVGQLADVESVGCQDDIINDQIGEACLGDMGPGAAGPVGFKDTDDFDQDGLANIEDGCPRQPVLRKNCDSDAECPDGATCSDAGICGHADHDADGVGDICDTCPFVSNPEQNTEAGEDVDDPDGDFIGTACEQGEYTVDHPEARPFSFYDVSANGLCCVTTYHGQPLLDPDGDPIDPASLGPLPPGVLELPPGCEQALASSEDGKAHAMKACHVDSPIDLWKYLCFLPGRDQDFDGVADDADLCPFAHDPTNAIYVDVNMMEWPNFGKYCNGDYSPSNYDPMNMCMP